MVIMNYSDFHFFLYRTIRMSAPLQGARLHIEKAVLLTQYLNLFERLENAAAIAEISSIVTGANAEALRAFYEWDNTIRDSDAFRGAVEITRRETRELRNSFEEVLGAVFILAAVALQMNLGFSLELAYELIVLLGQLFLFGKIFRIHASEIFREKKLELLRYSQNAHSAEIQAKIKKIEIEMARKIHCIPNGEELMKVYPVMEKYGRGMTQIMAFLDLLSKRQIIVPELNGEQIV